MEWHTRTRTASWGLYYLDRAGRKMVTMRPDLHMGSTHEGRRFPQVGHIVWTNQRLRMSEPTGRILVP